MKIIFLGLMFCDKSLEEAHRLCKQGVQMAPHLFEKKLTDGFKACKDVSLEIIAVPPIGSYPINYNKIYTPSYYLEGFTQIGYLNLPYIKRAILIKRIWNELKKNITSEDQIYIIAYSLFEPFLDVLKRVKRKINNAHITILQPDAIPGRNGMIKSKKMKKIGNRLVFKAKCANDFVFLSEHLKDVIEIDERNYTVVDCLCDPNILPNIEKSRSENIFLYTGTTAKIYGMKNLVDAFKDIPDAKLWICGSGDSDEYIRQVSKLHNNIKHFGYLTQSEVAKLRDKCDFLINPRIPTGTYTKYSFPSKTAEYLMSGKPVVMYHLEGISSEYDEFINYLYATDVNGIRKEICKIIDGDYIKMKDRACQARKFMIEKKSAAYQAEKIINMIKNNNGEFI